MVAHSFVMSGLRGKELKQGTYVFILLSNGKESPYRDGNSVT